MEYFAPVPYFEWFRKHPEQGASTNLTAIRFGQLLDALMDFFGGELSVTDQLKIVGESRTETLDPLYYLNLGNEHVEVFFFYKSSKWLVSVRTTGGQKIILDWDGIIIPDLDERSDFLDAPSWVFGPYSKDQEEFSFSVQGTKLYTVFLYLIKAAKKFRW